MNHPNDLWMNLPELVLTDIYKLLDLKDRLAASSTCKQWRNVLFQSWYLFFSHFLLSTVLNLFMFVASGWQ